MTSNIHIYISSLVHFLSNITVMFWSSTYSCSLWMSESACMLFRRLGCQDYGFFTPIQFLVYWLGTPNEVTALTTLFPIFDGIFDVVVAT